MLHRYAVLCSLAVCATSSGCLAVALGGGAAGAAYMLGDMNRLYSHDMDVVWHATLGALDEMQLSQGHQSKDQLKAQIERYTAAGDRIRIRLTRRGTSTHVNLRVNTFGNKAMSLELLQRIEQYLPREIPGGPTHPPDGGAH